MCFAEWREQKENLCNTDKLRLGKFNEDKNTQNCQKQLTEEVLF